MKLNLARPPKDYDQNDQAQTRAAIAAAVEKLATVGQLGADIALIFADLPVGVPAGTRRFVTDRGSHGKPVWWTADGHWVDGVGTIVT